MRKFLAILGMITCMVGLTACGAKADATPLLSNEQAIEEGKAIVESLNDMYKQGYTPEIVDDKVASGALASWINAQAEMGSYQGILDASADISSDEAIISVVADGTDHDATVEIIVDKNLELTSVTTTVIKSFGEMMVNAALNTLIGMGTVFVVLILISFIISLFGYIPKIQESFKKKETVQEKAVDNAVAQIIENEEQSDDLELVAVIAAAIAASEGAASTDGYVVRSIRRRF